MKAQSPHRDRCRECGLSTSNIPSKGDLLEHYCRREPKRFLQIDSWQQQGRDSVYTPDEDGDVISTGYTHELMHGHPVRVLIEPGTPTRDAVRMLRKIRESLKQGQYSTLGGAYPLPESDSKIPY